MNPRAEPDGQSAVCDPGVRSFSGRPVEGSSLSERIGKKWIQELGLNSEDLRDMKVHREADVAHSDPMETVFLRYGSDSTGQHAVLQAAQDSLEVDPAFRGT
jgi:hypothetical protein